MGYWRKVFGNNSDLFLVVGMLGILLILFTPIPSKLLDFLLLLNLSFALVILLLTFYVEKPVDFSTFPPMLLIATLFRLSLNIAATRLILSDGDAGKVIGAIGSHVVQSNYVIGLVVFLILVVVQYVVVTNGAQRVAEVAARFTLDSMPGQQMSIDADLNMGFIDQAEAQRRRKNIEKEANFYGAMDGASKFVKGDAIAGIVILLINIFGGLAVGVMQMGMSWQEAAQTFTLLTIGDGIVTQVPALVIAVGTGIIVTRSGTDSRLSNEIATQISAYPRVLGLVMIALLGVGLLPGMPLLPLIAIVIALGVLALFVRSAKKVSASADSEAASDASDDLENLLTVDPIEVRVGQGLIGLVNTDDSTLVERIGAFRKQYALEAGFIMPKVKIRDDKKLPTLSYQVAIFGVVSGDASLVPEHILAIHPSGTSGQLEGTETKDPTYGLPAVWISEQQRATARSKGFTLVDPLTVFVTHLTELLRRNAANLLTRSETTILLDRARAKNASLVEELIPGVLSLVEIQKVLQNLLREKVSIRNLEAILEVLADAGRQSKQADVLTEVVRNRLGPAICQALIGNRTELSVLTLDPVIEQKIAEAIQASDDSTRLVLDPRFAEQVISKLAGQVETMMKNNFSPVLLCAPELRRHLRSITERVLPHLAIVSMSEVPNTLRLQSFGVVKV
ncbi:flagellar biosynthesis protein FlhA [Pseudomethylobacillus aquaticus]|uniref:Flagellar biosynthesis protein FlhA n=1 Tax=Pseudomethylobacillus aquaticus TaxID=2676064 RepID=A0A3N0UZU4_9PROT|nr:flagellar biosynthesis protein FlhA [Pseudomethylobacillus aquaticus]ROH85892.1 flagellar biosynthesis protein FlhA [Pseudomethylobacillus aquaticus]